MLTRKEIRAVASATVLDHGMHLVAVLKQNDNYDGGNLVALLELFADRVLAANDGDGVVGAIDAKLGGGWTRQLAEALIGASAGAPPKVGDQHG